MFAFTCQGLYLGGRISCRTGRIIRAFKLYFKKSFYISLYGGFATNGVDNVNVLCKMRVLLFTSP